MRSIAEIGEEHQQPACFDHPNGMSLEKQVYNYLTSMLETAVLPGWIISPRISPIRPAAVDEKRERPSE